MKSLIFTFLLVCCAGWSLQAQATELTGDWMMSVTNAEGETFKAQLTLEDNNTYLADLGMDVSINVRGNYTLEGDQITIMDTGGDNACADGKVGVYKYRVNATELLMTMVSDDCEGRSGPEGKMLFTKM